MKPCPFCAESIQDAAIKCRYCGSLLVPEELARQELSETGAGGGDAAPRATAGLPLAWIAAAAALALIVVIAALLLRAAPPAAAPEAPAAVAVPPAVPHRLFGIAWGTPINEVTAQLASRGFRFTEQDDEGDHVFQGDIEGRPAVVIAMLARGGLAKMIVIMVGQGEAEKLYAETNRRLASEYGPPEPDAKGPEGPPITRWPSAQGDRATRLWTTITERGDVAIHYESELWTAESRRRKVAI